jgi:hypothetical protein
MRTVLENLAGSTLRSIQAADRTDRTTGQSFDDHDLLIEVAKRNGLR